MSYLVKALIVVVSIFLCLFVGKLINAWVGGLPASLYGLLLFALFLNTSLLEQDATAHFIAKVIYFMPLVFVPVCVGVMQYADLFRDVGVKLLLIGVGTTLLGIVAAAWGARIAFSLKDKKSDRRDV